MMLRSLVGVLLAVCITLPWHQGVPLAEAQQVEGQLPPVVHQDPNPPFTTAASAEGPVAEAQLSDEEWREHHLHDQIYGEGADADEFDDSDDHIFDEWETHMEDFVPDMLVNFNIAPRSDEFFYQDVIATPTRIRGGFFVAGDGQMEFTITDPNGAVVFHKTEVEHLFYFDAEVLGTYTFAVSNHKWMVHKQVTLAVGVGNSTSTLMASDVDNAVSNANHIDRMIRDIQSESSYLWQRQRGHMNAVKSTRTRVTWFAALEMTFLIVTLGAQVFYIKTLVSDRRMY